MKYFGTDGIRGRAGEFPLLPDFLQNLGRVAAESLAPAGKDCRVLIGRDTRESGQWIFLELCAGLQQRGCVVFDAGVLPTAALSAGTRAGGFAFGIMITASHNPWDDNGVKFFRSDGYKLSEQQEKLIEEMIQEGFQQNPSFSPSRIVQEAEFWPEARAVYSKRVLQMLGGKGLAGLSVVVDCANGAASDYAPWLLRECDASVFAIHNKPDGRNINSSCGSLYPQDCMRQVLERRADLGICLDGDADRVTLVDEKGSLLDGDDILALLAADMHRRGELHGGKVVATVLSNLGLDDHLAKLGLTVVRTAVGDAHVIRAMQEHGSCLGGEQSGHIVVGTHSTTGDGLMTAVCVLRSMAAYQKSLSELRTSFRKYPQKMFNIAVRYKHPINSLGLVSNELKTLEQKLNGCGRVLLRYSGTEPKIRLLIEAPSGMDLDSLAAPLIQAIHAEIGA